MPSFARSPTSRSRVPSAVTSTAGPPTGSRRLAGPEDLAELLAHHYIAVLEYSEPDAELTARAGRALTEAGDRALALNAYGTAARFYRRAMDLAAEDKRGRVLFGLGSALEALADPEAGELLVEASAQLAAEDDPETAAEAETLLAQIAWTTGDAAGVVEHSGRAVELVRGRPPSAAHARALGQAARFAMLDARWSEAVETGKEAERMAAELGLEAIQADALATVGTARGDVGDRSGDADLERAIELAERANAPMALSRALNNLAARYTWVDAWRTYELNLQNYETMTRYGHVRQIVVPAPTSIRGIRHLPRAHRSGGRDRTGSWSRSSGG